MLPIHSGRERKGRNGVGEVLGVGIGKIKRVGSGSCMGFSTSKYKWPFVNPTTGRAWRRYSCGKGVWFPE